MLLTDEIEQLININLKQLDALFKEWNTMGINERTLKTHDILHSISILHEDATSILTELVREYPPCPVDRLETMRSDLHSMRAKVDDFIAHNKDYEEMNLTSLENLLEKCMGKVMKESEKSENGEIVKNSDIDKAKDPGTRIKEANEGINFSRKNMLGCIKECCSRIEPILEQAIEKLSDLTSKDYQSKFDIRLERTIKENKKDFLLLLAEQAKMKYPNRPTTDKQYLSEDYEKIVGDFQNSEIGKAYFGATETNRAEVIAKSSFAKDENLLDGFFEALAQIEILKKEIYPDIEESEEVRLSKAILDILPLKTQTILSRTTKNEFLVQQVQHWNAVFVILSEYGYITDMEKFCELVKGLDFEKNPMAKRPSVATLQKIDIRYDEDIDKWRLQSTNKNEDKNLDRYKKIAKALIKSMESHSLYKK